MVYPALSPAARVGLYSVSILLAVAVLCTSAAGSGPISPIEHGFGAEGVYSLACDTLLPTRRSRHAVYVYSPECHSGASPVVFIFPGFGHWEPAYYGHIISHVVSRGNCVVFVPYRLSQFPYQRRTFRRMADNAVAGLRALGGRGDSSRVGFIGHSFGASAVPDFAWHALVERSWGTEGAYLFVMAPFYLFRSRQRHLASFPGHTKLIVQVYEQDDCNDHRMAKDLFDSIGIDEGEKDFYILRSDTCRQTKYCLCADHGTPFSDHDPEGEVDGLDYYGIYRPLDALAAYALKGDTAGKRIALGNGSRDQRFMGTWPDGTPVRPSLASDEAPLLCPPRQFYFSWYHPWNIRRRRDHIELDDPWAE